MNDQAGNNVLHPAEMPTSKKTLSTTDLLQHLHQHMFVCNDTNESRRVGLEVELIPLFLDLAHEKAYVVPFQRPADSELLSVLSSMNRLAERVEGLILQRTPDGIPVYREVDAGLITFEPGGQVEYSTAPRDSASAALEEAEEFIHQLESVTRDSELYFLTTGINPWHTVEEIGLQVNKPRYAAMDEYFTAIGPYGRRMMRQTCSTQVNVDLGDAQHMPRRWKAANLLAPIFTALFANSPIVNGKPTDFKSFRSHAWQRTDSGRTGFPPGLLESTEQNDPAEQYLQYALEARVMIIRQSDVHFIPITDPFPFRRWLENGHPLGYPSIEDWDYHLSTLFPEVRPRGFLEVRCIDGQSKPWRSVPVTLVTALLYDDSALETTIDILGPWQPRLPELSARAARHATHDEILGPMALQIFRLALDSLPRFSLSELSEFMRRAAAAFCGRYVEQFRCPADDFHDSMVKLNGQRFLPSHYLLATSSQKDLKSTSERFTHVPYRGA